jgi:hypothetical protein
MSGEYRFKSGDLAQKWVTAGVERNHGGDGVDVRHDA